MSLRPSLLRQERNLRLLSTASLLRTTFSSPAASTEEKRETILSTLRHFNHTSAATPSTSSFSDTGTQTGEGDEVHSYTRPSAPPPLSVVSSPSPPPLSPSPPLLPQGPLEAPTPVSFTPLHLVVIAGAPRVWYRRNLCLRLRAIATLLSSHSLSSIAGTTASLLLAPLPPTQPPSPSSASFSKAALITLTSLAAALTRTPLITPGAALRYLQVEGGERVKRDLSEWGEAAVHSLGRSLAYTAWGENPGGEGGGEGEGGSASPSVGWGGGGKLHSTTFALVSLWCIYSRLLTRMVAPSSTLPSITSSSLV